MNQIPLVDLKIQYKNIKSEIDEAIRNVINKTNFIMGEEITKFEEAFAKFIETKYAIGVSSGTDAIHLSLVALGISRGDEVIIPSHTFTASAEPIIWQGARPVFVDVDELTYTIDPERIESVITEKTKAIIPVHLYGHPANMGAILKIARIHDIFVIEDCAQAHGAKYKGMMVGNFGDLSIFSFFPGKNLGAYGDAGMVVTNNKSLADKVRLLRNHGRAEKYTHEIIGYGDRLDTIQAAILQAKLKHLKKWNSLRRENAKKYTKILPKIKEIKLPQEASWATSVYHLYVVRVKDRDNLKKYLKEKGIETGIHYPIPLHLQPAYRSWGGKVGDFPQTEKIAKEILSLPMYPELTSLQIKHICACIENFYS